MLPKQNLRTCLVCHYDLGRYFVCKQILHRVCASCYGKMLGYYKKISCPICRISGTPDGVEANPANAPHITHNDVQVTCTDCNKWSGPLKDISAHIRSCNLRDYPCSYEMSGCRWKGPQSQMEVHERTCEKARAVRSCLEATGRTSDHRPARQREEGSICGSLLLVILLLVAFWVLVAVLSFAVFACGCWLILPLLRDTGP
ncbi:MAG: hypothetical protein OXC07_00485 [Kistimonas sp.]|nr:hypothetical protein [Kistimonas sp.]